MNLYEVSLVNSFYEKLKNLKSFLQVSVNTCFVGTSSRIKSHYVNITFSISANDFQNKKLILSIDHDSGTLNTVELTTLDQLWSRIIIRSAPYPIGGIDIYNHAAALISQLTMLPVRNYLEYPVDGVEYNRYAKSLLENYNFSRIEWPSAAG